MTTFRDQEWNTRFAVMGDKAEQMFEAVYPLNWVRNGLNRPPLKVSELPERIRYQPDYLTTKTYVECKGIGRDQTLKIKVGEFSCMNYWHGLHPLEIFVWDSHKKRWAIVPFQTLREVIEKGGAELGSFSEGKAYFAIKVNEWSFFQWTKVNDG